MLEMAMKEEQQKKGERQHNRRTGFAECIKKGN